MGKLGITRESRVNFPRFIYFQKPGTKVAACFMAHSVAGRIRCCRATVYRLKPVLGVTLAYMFVISTTSFSQLSPTSSLSSLKVNAVYTTHCCHVCTLRLWSRVSTFSKKSFAICFVLYFTRSPVQNICKNISNLKHFRRTAHSLKSLSHVQNKTQRMFSGHI